jgi:exopolysaccharide production protein ExoZ
MNTQRADIVAPAPRYAALDGIRGFAVLLVFLVHAAGMSASVFLGIDFDVTRFATLSAPDEKFLYWLYCSHHGVFLFFVLSGFLIGALWWPQPKFGYREFVLRRTLRIYPAFLLSFAAAIGVALYFGSWHPPEMGRVLANLFLVNGLSALQVVPFNPVTWSLFYEMVFYLVFPLCILVARPMGAAARWVIPGMGIIAPAIAVAMGADPIHLCWSLLFFGVALGMNPKAVGLLAATVPARRLWRFTSR